MKLEKRIYLRLKDLAQVVEIEKLLISNDIDFSPEFLTGTAKVLYLSPTPYSEEILAILVESTKEDWFKDESFEVDIDFLRGQLNPVKEELFVFDNTKKSVGDFEKASLYLRDYKDFSPSLTITEELVSTVAEAESTLLGSNYMTAKTIKYFYEKFLRSPFSYLREREIKEAAESNWFGQIITFFDFVNKELGIAKRKFERGAALPISLEIEDPDDEVEIVTPRIKPFEV